MKDNLLEKKIHPKNTTSLNFRKNNNYTKKSSNISNNNKIKQIKSDRIIMKIKNYLSKINKDDNSFSDKKSLLLKNQGKEKEKLKNNINVNLIMKKANIIKHYNTKTNPCKKINNTDIEIKRYNKLNSNDISTKIDTSIYDPITDLSECFTPCFNKEKNTKTENNNIHLTTIITDKKLKNEFKNQLQEDRNNNKTKKITVIRIDKKKRNSVDIQIKNYLKVNN